MKKKAADWPPSKNHYTRLKRLCTFEHKHATHLQETKEKLEVTIHLQNSALNACHKRNEQLEEQVGRLIEILHKKGLEASA